MNKSVIGAGILSIITESLYDKPIVVFREYVQNSIDSLKRINNGEGELYCKIKQDGHNLFFLDNGEGITKDEFQTKMRSIAWSSKDKVSDIGYKGIGRLSGISYCNQLIFINIVSYKEHKYQKYTIDAKLYYDIKDDSDINELEFEEIMDKIGKYTEELNEVPAIIEEYSELFSDRDTGFLVILSEINPVLYATIEEKDFVEKLGWLLPVNFKSELLEGEFKNLFENFLNRKIAQVSGNIYNVEFNDETITRPIVKSMLREYNCKFNIGSYAIGFQSFPSGRMVVNKSNKFNGIKLYLDNMLLCDESEIIPMLKQLGLINHTVNELVVSVHSIGAMIYITDKMNIVANARRTFIEVTDSDSIDFLKLIAEFIERIYDARYAMSKFMTGKETIEISADKLESLRQDAENKLQKLADNNIELSIEDKKGFTDLTDEEKQRKIKQKITKEINKRIKEYLSQISEYDYDNAYENFKVWLSRN